MLNNKKQYWKNTDFDFTWVFALQTILEYLYSNRLLLILNLWKQNQFNIVSSINFY